MGRKPVDSNLTLHRRAEGAGADRTAKEGKGFHYILHGMTRAQPDR